MYRIIVLSLYLLILSCSSREISEDGIIISIVELSDKTKVLTIKSDSSYKKEIRLNSEGKVEAIITPVEGGQEVLTFDTGTGYLSTKVIKDALGEIQGVAYDFSRYGYLKGAYNMQNGRNKDVGFLYKDGLNSLDAVLLYDSLGNHVDTRRY